MEFWSALKYGGHEVIVSWKELPLVVYNPCYLLINVVSETSVVSIAIRIKKNVLTAKVLILDFAYSLDEAQCLRESTEITPALTLPIPREPEHRGLLSATLAENLWADFDHFDIERNSFRDRY